MLRIPLSDPARQPLAETCKHTTDRRGRDRCHALLMADRARPPYPIAADVSVTVRPLPRGRKASRVGGLEGWAMQWAAGRTPSSPAPMASELRTWVQQGPVGGLDRAHGT